MQTQHITKHLNTADQIRLAACATSEDVSRRFPALAKAVALPQNTTEHEVHKAITEGREQAATVKALAAAYVNGDQRAITSFMAGGAVGKSAVPAATAAGSPLAYPGQTSGVTALTPQVTRSLIQMLKDNGAPSLPPNKRVLTQPANLAAAEIPEMGMYPGAAPGSAFLLSGMRKFGLLIAFNDELLALGSDEVVAWVEAVLSNAANNAIDAAVIAAMQAAAGTAQTSVNAAFDAFTADLRTAVWVGSPDTLGKLRSAQERDVSPRGGSYYGLPALPVLACPPHSLFLVDAARTAVYDGPQLVERSNQADVVLDSAPTAAMTPVHLFQENKTALKVTKWADAHLMTNPVAVTVQ